MPRQASIGVIFADIRGYTTISERLSALDVLELLQDFQARMEHIAKRHGGSLSGTAGDGLLITFGLPTPGPSDATHALACAREMLDGQTRWNVRQTRRGEQSFAIGIGAHYGVVAVGVMGGERSHARAAIGDTVNIANRLQGLTRTLATDLVVSTRLVEEARREAGTDQVRAIDGLVPIGAQALRGRSERVLAHILPKHGNRRWQSRQDPPAPSDGNSTDRCADDARHLWVAGAMHDMAGST